MNVHRAFLATGVAWLVLVSPRAIQAAIIYVDADASDAHDGLSWASAFIHPQDALAVAQPGDEIWVAEGTYMPDGGYQAVGGNHTPGCGDRNASFQLINGVAVYGGFDGTEILLGQRDPRAHVTILSGDLLSNDNGNVSILDSTREDNSYRVFYHPAGTNLDGTAVLDGFTITAANANTLDEHALGGGMCNYFSSPTVANCRFHGNVTRLRGGGMYNYGSSPTVTNCTFSANFARRGGGMYNSHFSRPMVANCRFIANSARSGSGMYNNDSSSPVVMNCTFSSNGSEHDGGGMANDASSRPTVTNCTFSGNSVHSYGHGGAMYSDDSASPAVANCIFWGNSAVSGPQLHSDSTTTNVTYSCVEGGYRGAGNIDTDPQFGREPNPGPDGKWDGVGDDYGDLRLRADSSCIDAGHNAAIPADIADLDGDGDTTERTPLDLAGEPRFVGMTPSGRTGFFDPRGRWAIVDMGAYEASPSAADFDHDGDVDLVDFAVFSACVTGPETPYSIGALPPGCPATPGPEGYIPPDFDHDRDVDQTDFGIFQRCQSGPGMAADPGCAD